MLKLAQIIVTIYKLAFLILQNVLRRSSLWSFSNIFVTYKRGKVHANPISSIFGMISIITDYNQQSIMLLVKLCVDFSEHIIFANAFHQ